MPWFHGRITRQKAKELMLGGPPGYFLVRFSETNPTNFSLTYLDEVAADTLPSHPPSTSRSSSRVSSEPELTSLAAGVTVKSKHVLIYNLPTGFALSRDASKADIFPSIRELVEYHSAEWSKPCPSSLAHQCAVEMERLRKIGTVRVLNTTDDGFSGFEGNISSIVLSGGENGGAGAALDDSDDDSEDDSNAAYSNPSEDGSGTESGDSPPMSPEPSPSVPPSSESGGDRFRPLPRSSASSSNDLAAQASLPLLPPGDYEAWLNLSMLSVASGKYHEALRVLDEVLAQVKDDDTKAVELRSRAAKIKGTVLQEIGNIDEACGWFEIAAKMGREAMEQSPATVDLEEHYITARYVHHQLISNYISSQQFDRVIVHYEQLMAYTDDDAERDLLLADFDKLRREYDFWHGVSRSVVQSELDEGIRLFRDKRVELALEKFERTIQMARLTCKDRRIEARALGNYATVNRELKRYGPGIMSYQMSCRIFKGLADRQMVSMVWLLPLLQAIPFLSSPTFPAGDQNAQWLITLLHGRGAIGRRL